MIDERDAGRAIRTWLDDEPAILPTHVFDAVIAEIPRVPQRRHRLPFGSADRAWARWLVAATIASVVLAAGLMLIAGSRGWTLLATPPRPLPEGDVPLDAGRYVVDRPFPVHFSLDVPDGWAAIESTPTWVAIRRDRSGGPEVIVTTVEGVYADPCHPDEGLVAGLGPRVQDLAAALSRRPGLTATAPSATHLGVLPATEVRLSAPTSARGCQAGAWPFLLWGIPETFGLGQGDRAEIRIADVDGIRLVVVGAIPVGASAADLAQLEAVRDSLRFGDDAAVVPDGVVAATPAQTIAPEPPILPVPIGEPLGPGAYLAKVQLYAAGADGRALALPFEHDLVFPGQNGWFGTRQGIATSAQGPAAASMRAWAIDAIHPDPCRWQTSAVRVSLDDLDALAASLAAGWRADSPAAPTASAVKDPPWNGRQARELELAVPLDVDPSTCDGGELRLWDGLDGSTRVARPGERIGLRIGDADPGLVVVDVAWSPDASIAQIETLVSTLGSTSIVVP